MDWAIAGLPELVEVAERRGAIMMLDDAHASGVLGAGGAGTVDHFGLHGRVDVQVGTLSKANGVLGGVNAGPDALIEWLQDRVRPHLLWTADHTEAGLDGALGTFERVGRELGLLG